MGTRLNPTTEIPLQSRSSWWVLQGAVLLLPFSALLGSLGVLGVSLALWQQRWATIVRRPLNWGFAGLSGLLLLGTLLAARPTDAALGLFNFLPFFVIFTGLSELLQTAWQLRRLGWLLLLGSLPVVTIGLGQIFLGWSGSVQWGIVQWIVDPTGNPPGRMAAIFFYANVLASYLVVTFSVSLGLWLEAISRVQVRSHKLQWGKFQWERSRSTLVQLALLSVALVGNAIALVLTDSRNAWAVAVLACLSFGVYVGWRGLLLVASLVSGSVVGAAFAPSPLREGLRTIVPAFFWTRLTDERFPDRPIAELRTTQWKFAWNMVQQRPWTGWGFRNFSPLYEAKMQFFVGHPHNLFLMLAAETGLPATLLFLGLVGWVVWQSIAGLGEGLGGRGALQPMPLKSPKQGVPIEVTYLVAFLGCTLFSLLDITLFDVRINLLGWLLLAALRGRSLAKDLSLEGGIET